MNMKNNRRVQLTKKMIKEAFLTLLDEKDIQSITVRELCNVADVNRATFYKYYDNEYALLNEMNHDFYEKITFFIQKNKPESLVKLLEYVAMNITECNIILKNQSNPDFLETILNQPAISEAILSGFANDSSNLVDYKKEFYIYGSYHIALKWIENKCKEPAGEIANLIYKLTK